VISATIPRNLATREAAVRTFALLVVLLIVVGGCRTAPIQNVSRAPLTTVSATKVTMADVSKAISTAGGRMGWVMQEVRPGELLGILTVRKHVAVVAITHDTSTFNIAYKDSQNLMHQGDEIHRNYNRWVQNLRQAIQSEVARIGAPR